MKTSSSLFGATSLAVVSAIRVAIMVIILPVIGRILGPHAYGQIALVSPFIFFSMLIAESGLGACIVRAEKLTPELEGTIFSFSAAFSLLIIAIFSALSYPLGKVLDEPLFPPLLMGMSSILLLASLNIVPAALLLRNKQYNAVALSDILSTFGGVVGVVVGIYFEWGVWSLVAQQISYWLCKVITVVIASGFKPRFIFHYSIIKENIRFGSNLTGSSILSFISRNIDNILIGAFMGSELLGYYSFAFQIVGLPQVVLSGSVYYTIFSKTSEAYRTGNISAVHYLKILRGVLLVSTPALIGLAVTAPVTVPLFLGTKWLPMIKFIMFLVPFGFTQVFGAANSGVIIGLGRTDLLFRLTIIGATTTILAILMGVYISGSAVAIGVSIASFLGLFISLRIVSQELTISVSQLYKAIAGPVISSIAMGLCVYLLDQLLLSDLNLIAQLTISIIIGIITYLLILFLFFHDQLRNDISDIKQAIFSRSGH